MTDICSTCKHYEKCKQRKSLDFLSLLVVASSISSQKHVVELYEEKALHLGEDIESTLKYINNIKNDCKFWIKEA